MKRKIKLSFIVAITSIIIAFLIFVGVFIVVALFDRDFSGAIFNFTVFSEIICVLVYFISLCIYYTNGYMGKANISEQNMPEEFELLYKKLEEKCLNNLKELKKGLPIVRIGKWIAGTVAIISISAIINSLTDGKSGEIYWWLTAIITSPMYIFLQICDVALEKDYKAYYKQNCVKNFIELVNPDFKYQPRAFEKQEEFKELYNESKCDDIKRYKIFC